MSTTTDLDSNQWYRMSTADSPTDYFSYEFIRSIPSDENQHGMEWQLLRFSSTVWAIRCHLGGADVYLGAVVDSSDDMWLVMVHNETADASVYWEIISWGDGSWALRSDPKPEEHSFYKRQKHMTTAAVRTTTPEPTVPANVRWSFESVSPINDAAFFSIYLPGSSMTISDSSVLGPATTDVTSSSSVTSYPTSPDYTAPPRIYHTYSPGLSTVIKAVIGAGVGVAILIGLVLL
ncbi:hypothetical protein PTNB85_07556 [Pyrenophora teres f. teres]|nr:hypothetical protein PTNB85_07556 [Pyrenophora teres f. teres]